MRVWIIHYRKTPGTIEIAFDSQAAADHYLAAEGLQSSCYATPISVYDLSTAKKLWN